MKQITLANISGKIELRPRVHYINYPFTVPNGTTRVGFVFTFHKEKLAQYFVSLHDQRGLRGNKMKPSAVGDVELALWVGLDEASDGGVPGEISPGEWRVQIDIERTIEESEYRLEIYAIMGEPTVPYAARFDDRVLEASPAWYCGELHCHSAESDGKYAVAEVVREASRVGLDFLSMTDHFTWSQWRKLSYEVAAPLSLIRGCEITSHRGHANLHGLSRWVDVYVDRDDWSMNQAADATHEQGGLFCVNHAFSGDLCWRDFAFDWNKADAIEIYHNLEACNNAPMLAWWDHLLGLGRKIVGVGGTDSHDPFEGTQRLGQCTTWVYADELSQRGILAGIKRGRVYVYKGAQLRFSASVSGAGRAEMWETVNCGEEPVHLSVEVLCPEPARLYIIKDGLILDHMAIGNKEGEWEKVEYEDRPSSLSFYRIEIHKDTATSHNPAYPGLFWRDYSTTLALSNPVFARPGS